MALELCDFRAGALPLGTRSLIDFITEAARRQNIDVTWFRHGGHPVAMLQLQANQSRSTFQLRRLEVHDGRLDIASSPTTRESAPPPGPTAALPAAPPSLAPFPRPPVVDGTTKHHISDHTFAVHFEPHVSVDITFPNKRAGVPADDATAAAAHRAFVVQVKQPMVREHAQRK